MFMQTLFLFFDNKSCFLPKKKLSVIMIRILSEIGTFSIAYANAIFNWYILY